MRLCLTMRPRQAESFPLVNQRLRRPGAHSLECEAKGRHRVPPKYCMEQTYVAAKEPLWNWYTSLDQKLSCENTNAHLGRDGADPWALNFGTTKMKKRWTIYSMECGSEWVTREEGVCYLAIANVSIMNHWNKILLDYLLIEDMPKKDGAQPGPDVVPGGPLAPRPPTQAPRLLRGLRLHNPRTAIAWLSGRCRIRRPLVAIRVQKHRNFLRH